MQRALVYKIVLLLLPAAVILGILEFHLYSMNTSYFTKRIALENQLSEIEILTLGSSNAYYGINPDRFERKGYNLANLAQSMYYDQALAMKYMPRMPNLKIIILPAIFYTMGTELGPTSSQDFRMYFYSQYYGLRLEPSAEQLMHWGYLFDAKNFSKIALFGDNVYRYVLDRFNTKVDNEPQPSGWFDGGREFGSLKANVGPDAAKAHSMTQSNLYTKNLEYWKKIIVATKARGIMPIIIEMPTHGSYRENLNPDLYALFKKSLGDFAEKHQIEFHDYSDDPRFALEDFTYMVDHLNAIGASKFSTILNSDIVKPTFKRFDSLESSSFFSQK